MYVSKTEANLKDKTTHEILEHARSCEQCGVELLLLGCYALSCGVDSLVRLGALSVLCDEGDRIMTEGLIRDGMSNGMPSDVVEAGRAALAHRNAERATRQTGVLTTGERAKA